MQATDRYTIISSDCHAGADLLDYRPYLDAEYRDDFDAWAADFVNPYADLSEPDAARNWDSARRNADLDGQGIAGEVLFPNTIPPFFPKGSLSAAPPTTALELEQRWAGLRAHNRWLADFCSESPERRAGIGQILINDLDQAVAGVHDIAKAGLRGGVLLPGVPPDSGTRCSAHLIAKSALFAARASVPRREGEVKAASTTLEDRCGLPVIGSLRPIPEPVSGQFRLARV